MPHLTTTDSDVYCSPTGAPNVRFISSKVRTAAAIEEYNKAAKEFFNCSVELLLLAKNTGVTPSAEQLCQEHLRQTQVLCDQLSVFFKVAHASHSGGNLLRYLRHLLEKVDQYPSIDTFYEIASVAEVLAEGINSAKVCSL